MYPDYCNRWWITSPGTAGEIAKAAQSVKFFWIEDAWITGYIAKHLKIEHQVNILYLKSSTKNKHLKGFFELLIYLCKFG